MNCFLICLYLYFSYQMNWCMCKNTFLNNFKLKRLWFLTFSLKLGYCSEIKFYWLSHQKFWFFFSEIESEGLHQWECFQYHTKVSGNKIISLMWTVFVVFLTSGIFTRNKFHSHLFSQWKCKYNGFVSRQLWILFRLSWNLSSKMFLSALKVTGH